MTVFTDEKSALAPAGNFLLPDGSLCGMNAFTDRLPYARF